MKKISFILVTVLLISACSKSDDTVIVQAPELIVSQNLSANYFQQGESPLPEVQWNGNQGKFGLENTIRGLSIDAETGQLSWDGSLPIGVHTVILFAYNNAGKDLASLTINNQFHGTFKGTFLSSTSFGNILYRFMEINFNANGTLSGYQQSELNDGQILDPSYFNGSYVLMGNKMEGTFQYEDSESTRPFEAVLDQYGKLSGYYYITGFDITTEFELNMLISP